MIFDTHTHYDDSVFDPDRDELIRSLPGSGIGTIVNVGADIRSSQNTLDLIRRYPFVYGSVGVHPKGTAELDETGIAWLRHAAGEEKIVAIGEIGLDYHWNEPEAAVQKHWFLLQLSLARDCSLPVIIHSRDAAKDTLDIMKAERAGDMGGVIHCFSYSVEIAREYLKMGFYLGIGGVLTYGNARKLKEVVAYMPIDRIVLETDCPYLTPVPHRDERNSSLNLPLVIHAISAIKGISEDQVIAVTEQNARCLYRFQT
ncbi:MAG: TatD family hydrolase [Clostridiales bacterium]|nr:TatD family hydrolase [Clostridiales bacterium]